MKTNIAEKSLRDKLSSIISDFGDGETEFHTRDIECLLKILDEKDSENLQLKIDLEAHQTKGVFSIDNMWQCWESAKHFFTGPNQKLNFQEWVLENYGYKINKPLWNINNRINLKKGALKIEDYDKLFLSHPLTLKVIEKGFNKNSLFKYSELSYPINDSGNDYKKTLCLFLPLENAHDEVRMIWIDNEDAAFHWSEGTYSEGEHSRCELVGDNLDAPMYQEVIDWLRETHKMHIQTFIGHDEDKIWYNFELEPVKLGYDYEPHTCDTDVEGFKYYETIEKAIEEALNLIP